MHYTRVHTRPSCPPSTTDEPHLLLVDPYAHAYWIGATEVGVVPSLWPAIQYTHTRLSAYNMSESIEAPADVFDWIATPAPFNLNICGVRAKFSGDSSIVKRRAPENIEGGCVLHECNSSTVRRFGFRQRPAETLESRDFILRAPRETFENGGRLRVHTTDCARIGATGNDVTRDCKEIALAADFSAIAPD